MTKALLKRLEEGKLYYSISEVCQITGLEQHVLRYWENEFPQLKPKKNRAGNRAYRAKEIKLIRYIKYLLYDEMYTIQGAKRKIADASAPELEGQVNLLGPLPGIGAAAPSAPTALPRKKKIKEVITATSEALHDTQLATLPVDEWIPESDEINDIIPMEADQDSDMVPASRELLMDLKRQLTEVLKLLHLEKND